VQVSLVYAVYVVAAIGAMAVYAALPKAGRPSRRGVVPCLLIAAVCGLTLLLGRLLGESAQRAYFFLLSVLAVGGAVRVITHPRPVYSALFFVLVVLSTAGLMVLAGAEFLGAALVIVYAGAILVTYVFVIMLAQQSTPSAGGQFGSVLRYDRDAREPLAAVLAGFVLVGTVGGLVVSRNAAAAGGAATATGGAGNTLEIGRVLLTDFAVSVELAGVLLMVAMVGAIAIARKRLPRGDEPGQELAPGEAGRRATPF